MNLFTALGLCGLQRQLLVSLLCGLCHSDGGWGHHYVMLSGLEPVLWLCGSMGASERFVIEVTDVKNSLP